jgi:gamma-glutamyltranspeptidase/glutathione hydrolase
MVVPPGVAAGHPATVEVGIRVLQAGGSAADAAVAAALAACVSESILTGLGGGGFATHFDASTGEVTCLDFFCAAPGLDGDIKARPMKPINVQFGEVFIPYGIGGASVAVPGVAAGCGEIHSRWGRLPWAEVVAPVVTLAARGVPMSGAHAEILPWLVEAMLPDQGRSAYAPSDVLLQAGDLLFHPGLADALAELAELGPQVLYTGKLAELMVDLVRGDGGALGPADLAGYQVLEVPVRTAQLGEYTICGRQDLNQAISTIASLPTDLSTMDREQSAIALATALQRGSQTDGFGDTTNVTVVDRDGNACVITTTLGMGAGLWLPGYGLHLNSMLGEEDLIIGELSPGDRIGSMMCPMVALDADGRLRMAIGSAGAARIRSALMGTLIGTLINGKDVPAAVSAARMHAVAEVVHLEPGYPPEIAETLRQAGFEVLQWGKKSHYFGGVSAIATSGAAGDPRRDGAATLLT